MYFDDVTVGSYKIEATKCLDINRRMKRGGMMKVVSAIS
jgi:hypothetical protein